MTQIKIEAKSRLSAATMLECGCETAKVCSHTVSALTDKQKKLDINKNGKIDGDDLKKVREGETAEATMLSAATPKEAAQYVVKVFNKNGFKIKFSRKGSDPDMLVFDMVALGGKKFSFGLHLEGKTVSMDSLGEDVFDPTTFVAEAVSNVNTKYLDFEKLGSTAFGKWEASTDNLAEQVGDAITRYKSFVERFNSAITEITAEMQKGNGKDKK